MAATLVLYQLLLKLVNNWQCPEHFAVHNVYPMVKSKGWVNVPPGCTCPGLPYECLMKISSYSVPKLLYGPLTLNIKMFTTSHKLTQA